MIQFSGTRTRCAAVAALLIALACGGGDDSPKPPAKPNPAPSKAATSKPSPAAKPDAPTDPAALAERGRVVYMTNCIACHNPDPTKDGALGPAVKGSSQELLEARVIHAAYPEGYTPKRETAVMVALPFLEPEIPALAAYLRDEKS